MKTKHHLNENINRGLQIIGDLLWFLGVLQGQSRQEAPRSLDVDISYTSY